MWSVKDKVITYDQAKADANNAKKDMKLVGFMHTLFNTVVKLSGCLKYRT